jgi:steroid delta-isomerase-like uncharacterized protein
MGSALQAAERFYESFAAGNFAGLTDLFAADCPTVTQAGTMTPAEHEAFGRAFKAALPDAHLEVDKVVEASGEVFIAGRFVGTHEADLATPQGTLPASGRRLDLLYANYFRVADDRIVEHRVFWDQAGLLGQLGAT